MTQIEERVEVARVPRPNYARKVFTDAEIAAGKHRSYIGGHWDTHGQHQLDFLVAQGLQPGDKFLDVGCGSLRAGRHLVDYLEPGNYYGIDANRSLIQAGYDVELTDEQRAKLPIANLRANERFDGDFAVPFDMAIAQSVFTHVSLNHMRLCLLRLAKVMRPGAKFYATFNEQPWSTSVDKVIERDGRHPHFSEQNVFWYYRADLKWAGSFGPWRYRYIGNWDHPGGQKMVEYTRLKGSVPSAAPSVTTSRTTIAKARRFAGRGLRAAARRVDPS
jgi:SAM-dependent methyltransferase